MSIANVGKAVGNFEQNIMRVVKEGTDLFFDPNHTKADELKWEQDVKNVFGDGIHDLGEEASSQAQEGAANHLMSRGLSKADAEKWVQHSWKKVLDISETVRKDIPKVEATAKLGWLKLVGVVTAIFTGALIFSYVNSGPSEDSKKMIDLVRRTEMEQEQIQRLSNIVLSDDEFNMMTGSLYVQSAPAPVIPDVPVAAAPEPLPAPIAAVAEQPVEVKETTSSGGEHRTVTTVERVYRSSPPSVQREIEQHPPPKIEHDYDKPSGWDRFCNDCLGAIDEEFGHKAYSITNGDGSATLSISTPR